MNYFKRTENGYITLIGTNCGGEKISENEYMSILQVIRSKPAPMVGHDYKLKESLEWELFSLPTIEESSDNEGG